MNRKALLLLIVSIITIDGFCQTIESPEVDNRKCTSIQDPVIMLKSKTDDSYLIDPSTFRLNGVQDSLYSLSFDAETGQLTIYGWNNFEDSVELCYRTINIKSIKLAHRTLEEYDSTALFKDYGKPQGLNSRREQLFETGEVNTAGTLSRGFTVGTNQDMFVNSSLNLTLDGKLTEDLFIQASITDNTIPYQPEGNTAQLQDFDNVYMRLYNDKFSITGGDIVLKNGPSRFLKYYKNVQGALVARDTDNSSTRIGASQAKGKFVTVTIEPIEGTLGPYKIRGPDGIQFVIILANSERIYLDGKLLKRGFDLDYTIDYNLGQITFTPRVIITKFSRINMDYEYADNNYSRSVITASHFQDIGKVSFFVNAYSEKDNKNQSNSDLSIEDKILLSEVGDNLDYAIRSGADSVEFDPSRILYKMIFRDSLEIFIHSTNPDSAYWDVKFSRTEPNSGHYVQKITTQNGRVFEWVEPINGVPQGDFVPYTTIPAPSKKQMVTFGGNYSLSQNERLFTEISVSNYDKNQYSEKDNADNPGNAINFKFESNNRRIGHSSYTFHGFSEIEYLNKYFTPIDRFRRVEFDRDWSSLPAETDNSFSDLLITTGIGIRKNSFNLLNYQFARRQKGYLVDGFQNSLKINQEAGPVRFLSDMFISTNSQPKHNSNWRKMNTDLSVGILGFRSGYTFRLEENVTEQSDSITYSANYFMEHILYLRSLETEKSYFDVSYSVRDDKTPYQGVMVESNQAQTANLIYNNRINKYQNLQMILTFRKLQNRGEEEDYGSGQNLTSRLDWSGLFFQNLLKNNLTYSVTSGRDLKKEYVFIEVPTGQGSYTWIDQNEDGIQDLNEFFLANNIDEKNFAKIFIPTNEFIDAFENTFNYRLNIRFPTNWRKDGGFKSLLSKLSNSTIWTSVSRITDESVGSRLFAFIKNVDREDILSMRENIRTTWFFNRGNPAYGINAGFNQHRVLNLLTGGFEDRVNKEFNFTGRVNIGGPYSIKFYVIRSKEFSESDYLNERNFIIDAKTLRPSFSWQPKPNFRLNMVYGIRRRGNVLDPERGERAIINEVSGELKLSRISKSNIQGSITLSNVDYKGEVNTPAGYAVLSGLRPGFNVNWSLNWQQNLIGGLQMSLNYIGRKSENGRVIHFGSASVNALF